MLIYIHKYLKVLNKNNITMNYAGIDINESFFYLAKLDTKSGKYLVKKWAYKTETNLKDFADKLDSSTDICVMEATGVYH